MAETEPNRPSFAFYCSFKDAINSVPTDKDKLEIYEAITDFAFLGKEPELSAFGKAMWKLIKSNLISSMVRFDRCVENGKKGAEHGKKGGRPRKEKPHDVDVDVYVHKFNKLNCVWGGGKHTLTQEEKKDLESRREVAMYHILLP